MAEEAPFKPEIEIFPHRLPSDETVANFLLKVRKMRGITQVTLFGPRVYYEKIIKVSGKVVPLRIQVARFWIEVEGIDVLEKLKDICDETFPYGFSIKVGRFTKYLETVGDRLRGSSLILRTDFLKGEE